MAKPNSCPKSRTCPEGKRIHFQGYNAKLISEALDLPSLERRILTGLAPDLGQISFLVQSAVVDDGEPNGCIGIPKIRGTM